MATAPQLAKMHVYQTLLIGNTFGNTLCAVRVGTGIEYLTQMHHLQHFVYVRNVMHVCAWFQWGWGHAGKYSKPVSTFGQLIPVKTTIYKGKLVLVSCVFT